MKEFFEDVPIHVSRVEKVRAKMSPGAQHQFVQDGITVFRGFPEAYRFYLFARREKFGLSERDMHKLFVQCIDNMDQVVRRAVDQHIHDELHMDTLITSIRNDLTSITVRNFIPRRPIDRSMRKALTLLDAQQLVDLSHDEGLYTPVQSKGNGLLKRR